ncbi:hypothetical protein O181_057931 [Austropuccinia psidii MF-1]|uniref:Uncharacterized protein n=1 Tax=Austropuccinia psidii MF-1 TaxID=1389203 RepID=A0A9Q3HUE1_9BASI|nr:hypothetical protein [Austropuccinia psidii MF-1]
MVSVSGGGTFAEEYRMMMLRCGWKISRNGKKLPWRFWIGWEETVMKESWADPSEIRRSLTTSESAGTRCPQLDKNLSDIFGKFITFDEIF